MGTSNFLVWDNNPPSDGVTAYKVYALAQDGITTYSVTVPTNQVSFSTLLGGKGNGYYTLSATAINPVGESARSTNLVVRFFDKAQPPKGLVAK